MTEQTRETILQQVQNEAYVSLKSYMRQPTLETIYEDTATALNQLK
jgi:hypothetical protein